MCRAEGQQVGAEGPSCRQEEVWKTPEGLEDRCRLTAKRQHYRRRNPGAWQRPVEDISPCTTQVPAGHQEMSAAANLSTGGAMHA